MDRIRIVVLGCAWLAFGAGAAWGDVLVPDSFRDRIMRLSSVDGSVIDLNFITNTSVGGVFQLPIEALPVGDEIWVSDQNADAVFRISQAGIAIGTVVGAGNGLDNIRGIGVIDGILYVTNFGNQNGAPGACIRLFDMHTMNSLGSVFPPFVQSPWDVVGFDGFVMVSDGGTITAGGDDSGYVFRLNANTGQYLSTFISGTRGSNGVSLPKGMCVLSNGNLLITNNSTPRNLYEYAPNGTRVATYPMGDLQANGVLELDNGEVLVCAAGTGVLGTNGFYALDRSRGSLRTILTGDQTSDGFIPNFPNRWTPPPPPPPACPGDFNNDGVVNVLDLTEFLGVFGQTVTPGSPGDFNNDGAVNVQDLTEFLGAFGTACPE